MMTYSEILAANCESTWTNETQSAGEGSYIESCSWITYDSKLSNLEEPKVENPNLKNLEVKDYTNAYDLGKSLLRQQIPIEIPEPRRGRRS